jgi:acetyl-CoA carboxylase biotin carboxyl carrier protein
MESAWRESALCYAAGGRDTTGWTRWGICGTINPLFEESAVARIEIKSEITGTVWKVPSKPGDTVAAGDTLVIIESMKMEIPVITEDPGKVLEIRVKEKDPVAEGQVVAVLEG